MFPLDFLGMPLAWTMHLRSEMPRVRPPMIRIKVPEAKGLQQRFQLQKDLILATPEDISQNRTRGVIDRMPEPPWFFLLANKTPHFIHLSFTGSLNVHVDLIGIQRAEQGRVDRLQSLFFLPELPEYRVRTDP